MITQVFAAAGPHVSLAAEALFSIGGFHITNSLIMMIMGYAIVIGLLVRVAHVVKKNKKRSVLVRSVLWIFEMLVDTIASVTGSKKLARSLAPLPLTMFFFIIIQYWIGILPFVGPIISGGSPVFRGGVADLNATFALAIVAVVAVQIYAVKAHGFFGNLGRYFKNPFKHGPIAMFEGVLELIAEFSRLVGLSLRLFGNVFAGEVLLVMVAFLTKWAAPVGLVPFYLFELFIGAIQAYIFFMLTCVFVSLGAAKHDHGTESSDHSPAVSPKVKLAKE